MNIFGRTQKWSLPKGIIQAQKIAEKALQKALEQHCISVLGLREPDTASINHMDIFAGQPKEWLTVSHTKCDTRKIIISLSFHFAGDRLSQRSEIQIRLGRIDEKIENSYTTAYVRLWITTSHYYVYKINGFATSELRCEQLINSNKLDEANSFSVDSLTS